jgi:hypothetical protein
VKYQNWFILMRHRELGWQVGRLPSWAGKNSCWICWGIPQRRPQADQDPRINWLCRQGRKEPRLPDFHTFSSVYTTSGSSLKNNEGWHYDSFGAMRAIKAESFSINSHPHGLHCSQLYFLWFSEISVPLFMLLFLLIPICDLILCSDFESLN